MEEDRKLELIQKVITRIGQKMVTKKMRRRDGVMCACLTFMVHTRNSLHQEKMMLLLTNNPDGTGAAALADAGCAPPPPHTITSHCH